MSPWTHMGGLGWVALGGLGWNRNSPWSHPAACSMQPVEPQSHWGLSCYTGNSSTECTVTTPFWKPDGGRVICATLSLPHTRSIPGATFSSSLCLCVSALSQHQYYTMSHGSKHRSIPKDLPKDIRRIIIRAEWAHGIPMRAVRVKTEAWAKQTHTELAVEQCCETLLSYARCVSDCLCTA